MTFADYMKEVYPDPFVLESSNSSVSINSPTDKQISRLDTVTDVVDTLKVLCGDQFSDIWGMCRHEPMYVCAAITYDLISHYGLRLKPKTGGWSGVVKVLADHGPELEYDLRAELGIDLYEFVRGDRPWEQLYRFMSRLPRHGHFYASLLDDDDTAVGLLEKQDEQGQFGLAGWTYERELLTTIVDVLGQIHATLIQVNSKDGSRPPVQLLKRPRTALDRVGAKLAREAHERRVRMLIPDQL